MAPTPRARRRPPSIRPRTSLQPGPVVPFHELGDDELAEERPSKRLKKSSTSTYRPGGPGGGGRWTSADGTDRVEIGQASDDDEYHGSRRRSARELTTNDSMVLQSPTYTRPRRDRTSRGPRYSSAAAAAAAAVAHGDGYKPREERGWEEFHPQLDVESTFAVYSAAEVDGLEQASTSTNDLGAAEKGQKSDDDGDKVLDSNTVHSTTYTVVTPKRRPGRPMRRANSMLGGLVSPDVPKQVPPPGPNPRERLTLPRPSYRQQDPFRICEEKNGGGQQNYVDRTMAKVGYQESEVFNRTERRLIRMTEGAAEEDLDLNPSPANEPDSNAAIGTFGVGRVEYDMDEQDEKWLEVLNQKRKQEEVEAIKPAIFEITMTKIEKEWHALEKRIPKPNPKPAFTGRPRSSSAAAVNGEPSGPGEEQDTKCAICDDGDCENANAIVFCDGCDLAVHQECYGVPYIPEGQWLCRKCQLIGRGTPTCVFCPNEEGAFKQTSTSKWAHLLCSIWIPEVTIGNPSLMEPVADIEKVPKNRWALNCYICAQKMGACIQCSHKSCYQAFHVSCGRRARLYLRMKAGHGGALLDSNQLKAYCHQHVPKEWEREHGTVDAFIEAKSFYHRTMCGRKWADSQKSALALVSSQPAGFGGPDDGSYGGPLKLTLRVNGDKKKPQKIWRLNSGAPIVPEVVLRSIEASLQKFGVRKKKEYVAEACKYWTLKREARRGAALLKRLQLSMDTFTSMEMTRRNFAGMGMVKGNERLDRRISFAETLLSELEHARHIMDTLKERERLKLADAELLRDLVDTVYTPITPLLWPILEKAVALDSKNTFREGFVSLRSRLENRFYTSVVEFSKDLSKVFSSELGVQAADDIDELSIKISGRAPAAELTPEQREKRKLAKRILKAIELALKDAVRKSGELTGRPYEKELQEMERNLQSRRSSLAESLEGSNRPTNGFIEESTILCANGRVDDADDAVTIQRTREGPETDNETDAMVLVEVEPNAVKIPNGVAIEAKDTSHPPPQDDVDVNEIPVTYVSQSADPAHTPPTSTNGLKINRDHHGSVAASKERAGGLEPISPPMSHHDEHGSHVPAGMPWYLEPFAIRGTTVHDEQWTGREVLRGMSEQLSEIDDEELEGLGGIELEQQDGSGLNGLPHTVTTAQVAGSSRTRSGKQRKHWKGFK